MPSLRQKPDGRFYLDYLIEGRRHRPPIHDSAGLPIRDAGAAQTFYHRWLKATWPTLIQESAGLATHDKDDPKLRDIMDNYVDLYLVNKNRAKKTALKADQVCHDFERFCAARHIGRMSQVTPHLVDQWALSLHDINGPKTIKCKLGLIRAAFNVAADRDLLPRSPIRKWIMPNVPEPEINPLTPDQVSRVLAIIRDKAPHIAPIITWIALTGNRPSDACALEWRQVDITRACVIRAQVKTKQLAHYELAPAALTILRLEQKRPWHDGAGPVFRNRHGDPLTVSKLYHDFTRTLEAARFQERKVTLKDFRTTFGSLMANDVGCPLPQLQRLMGHRDIKDTMRYIKPGNAAPYVHAYEKLLNIQAPNGKKRKRTA